MKRAGQAVIAALGVALAGSAAAYVRGGSYFDYARVQSVDRVIATVDEPRTREDCWTRPRTEYHPTSEYRREVLEPRDDADGKAPDPVVRREVIETGGYATTTDQRVCEQRTARVAAPQVIGYDVVYTYRGEDYHDRLDHDPGRSIRVHVDDGYVEPAE